MKAIKKKRPDVHSIDLLGRSCFHHAAIVGNSLGVQFTVQLLNYVHEKETNFKIPEGYVIPSV